jgi:formate/nitrite transporter FocA (FNT family)
MMTLVGGGELFTGNTALITASLIEKKTTLQALLKNWFFSYVGNFLGSIILAYLAFASGTLGTGSAASLLAVAKTSLPFSQAFVRGLLCNWLVCMAVYMASGASTLVSKMVAIWFPISAFIALGAIFVQTFIIHYYLIIIAIFTFSLLSSSTYIHTYIHIFTHYIHTYIQQAWSIP